MFNRTKLVSLIIILSALFITLASCGSKEESPAVKFAPIEGAGLRLVQTDGGTEIWVDDVTSFYALDMEIHFEAARAQIADANSQQPGIQIEPGQAPAPDFVAENIADNQAGAITYVVTQLAPREGFSGSGLVATIRWQGQADPAPRFGAVTLVSQDGQPIEVALAGN